MYILFFIIFILAVYKPREIIIPFISSSHRVLSCFPVTLRSVDLNFPPLFRSHIISTILSFVVETLEVRVGSLKFDCPALSIL